MYYDEKFEEGIWWWRGTPDGEWHQFGTPEYVRKIAQLQYFRSHAVCNDCGSYDVVVPKSA